MDFAREVPRYSLVSLSTMVLRIAVASALFHCLDWFHEYYDAALAVGYACQMAAESRVNPRWTFGNTQMTWMQAFLRTAAIEGPCLCLSEWIVPIAVEEHGLSFFSALLIVTPVTGTISFGLTRLFMRSATSRRQPR